MLFYYETGGFVGAAGVGLRSLAWWFRRAPSLASVKPLLAWVPSQNGFIAEPPHRHRASWGGRVRRSPSGSMIAGTLVTR